MTQTTVRYFVTDIEEGARFRGAIVEGPGGRQILLEDPAGNPVELFQPKSA